MITFSSTLRQMLVAVTLCTLAASACHAAEDAVRVQALRSQSYAVVINLLIYYNLSGAPFEPGNLDEAQQRLLELKEGAETVANPVLIQQVGTFEAAVADLKKLPQSSDATRGISPAYSRWMLPLVEQFIALEKLLSSLYVAQGMATSQAEVNALTEDIQQMTLSYQMTTFPSLGADIWVLDELEVVELDAKIERRFSTLMQLGTLDTTVLAKARRDYQFVQRLFLAPGSTGQPNAVGRYSFRILAMLKAVSG